MTVLGMLGLGAIGRPLAERLAERFEVLGYDPALAAGELRPNLTCAESAEQVARASETVLLCLPSPSVDFEAASGLLTAAGSKVRLLIDLSTVGIAAAERIAAHAAELGVGYVDAPVSASIPRAAAGEVTVMAAGRAPDLEGAQAVFDAIAAHVFVLGDRPGLGQAMKLANNIINATAMTVTCEAVAFGVRAGLDMAQMIEVLNVSTGRTSASVEKFPRSILPGSFAFGAPGETVYKDATLYLEAARAVGVASPVAEASEHAWGIHVRAHPHVDLTNLYRTVDEGLEWSDRPSR